MAARPVEVESLVIGISVGTVTTMTAAAMPSPGDVVHVGQAASVQFAGPNGIRFRVIRILEWPTYDGWTWIDGYQLNSVGDAVARRSIFVQIGGLRSATQDRPTAR